MASDKQVRYLQILCRQVWLFEVDFPAGTYRRKSRLAVHEADRLIKLGKNRKWDEYLAYKSRRMMGKAY